MKRKMNERINQRVMHSMPRKSKQSQKQRQKQSVKQTVIVKVGETSTKRKRSYRRKARGGGGGGQAQYIQPTQLPGQTIYQSNQITPVPFEVPAKVSITEPEPKKPKITEFQDVGVGTEGLVEVIDVKTKKETLGELTSPIPKRTIETQTPPSPIPVQILMPPKKIGKTIETQTPPILSNTIDTQTQTLPEITRNIETQTTPFLSNTIATQTPPPPSALYTEMLQAKPKPKTSEQIEMAQMGGEDAPSIMLGLSKFNYEPKAKITSGMEQPIPGLEGRKPYEPFADFYTGKPAKTPQQLEMSQMGAEDAASIMLGLSKFNYEPKAKITMSEERKQAAIEGQQQALEKAQPSFQGIYEGLLEQQKKEIAKSSMKKRAEEKVPPSDTEAEDRLSLLMRMKGKYGPLIEETAAKKEAKRLAKNAYQREWRAKRKSMGK